MDTGHVGVVGLLLAAGQGRRFGRPKALVAGEDGLPWVVASARMLKAGGCAEVVVVVGAAADEVRALLADEPVRIVEAAEWAEGMGASLRRGLVSVDVTAAEAALVHLVDLPDVGAAVVRRLLTHAGPDVLARATFDGVAGHPVLIGREHWAEVAAQASGDRGARDYLALRPVVGVDCSDLASGRDIDHR